MNLINIKFTKQPPNASSVIRLTALTIITFLAAGLFYFLYHDFYQTIVQAETVLVLKQEVALRDINLALFKKVKAVEDYKHAQTLAPVIIDPFATVRVQPPIDTLTNTN